MKSNIGDKARIHHILDAILEIEKYTSQKSLSDFTEDTMLQSACIRQLEIIGEAASRISDDLKAELTDIKWREIIGLRNILIHEYFGVDIDIIWQIIEEDIPRFKNILVSENKEIRKECIDAGNKSNVIARCEVTK
jgi:uncharacterized protein with HEPN domain